jgi:hydrogenase expression/formation protein HypC
LYARINGFSSTCKAAASNGEALRSASPYFTVKLKGAIGVMTTRPQLSAFWVRVISLLGDDWVEAEIGGVISRVSIALVSDIVVGDYLIVHAGFAITRLNVEEAELTLALFEEIAVHLEGPRAVYSRVS